MKLVGRILCYLGWHKVSNRFVTRRKPVNGKLTYPFWDIEGPCVRCRQTIKWSE